MPSWGFTQTPGAGASSGFSAGTAFSSRPSMSLSLPSDAPAGAQAGLVNRGIGYAGLSLEGGKPYSFGVWLWTGAQTTAFAGKRR